MSTSSFAPGSAPSAAEPDAPTPASAATASDRIVASRATLRAALLARAEAEARASSTDIDDPDQPLLARLTRRWHAWKPFGLAGAVAARAADAVVSPIVQRHPLRMTLGAAVVGGLLVWSRPWQWTLGSALLAGWLPRLVAQRRAPAGGNAWLPLVSAVAMALFSARDDGPTTPMTDKASTTNHRVTSR